MSFPKSRLLAAGALLMLAAMSASAQPSQAIIKPTSLTYLGSFKVPSISGAQYADRYDAMSYGGTGLTYNPANNSLYIVNHPYNLYTGEISIPALGGTATVLQPLTDAFAGKRNSVVSGGTVMVGGNFVYGQKLYMTAFAYYDGDGSQVLSHFSRSLTLSDPNVAGPYRVGPKGAGFYSGYMAGIPLDWQSLLGGPAITGNCCLSIISRTSYGPAAFAFDPENTAASAVPLVYYDGAHQTLGTYGASGSNPVFNGTTRITGAVFPKGTASLLFVGSTGIGEYCYGEGSVCGDPTSAAKGEHAYPYRVYVWAYNANDLAAVRAGTRQPWDVKPYATWELPELVNASGTAETGGVAYDEARGLLYISVLKRDGTRPLIYVYRITNAIAAPAPPGNVTVK